MRWRSPGQAMPQGTAAAAATLPQPIGALIAALGGRSETLAVGQARGELDQRYREQSSTLRTDHFRPLSFTPGSGIDVPLADFGRCSARAGFRTFFKENLAPLVDVTAQSVGVACRRSGPPGASERQCCSVRTRAGRSAKILWLHRPIADSNLL